MTDFPHLKYYVLLRKEEEQQRAREMEGAKKRHTEAVGCYIAALHRLRDAEEGK